MPPSWKTVCTNGRRGAVAALPDGDPERVGRAGEQAVGEGVGASAPKMMPGRKCPITWREATGAGCSQLRIEPSGAVTCTGRNAPSLCGTSGATAAFIAYDA